MNRFARMEESETALSFYMLLSSDATKASEKIATASSEESETFLSYYMLGYNLTESIGTGRFDLTAASSDEVIDSDLAEANYEDLITFNDSSALIFVHEDVGWAIKTTDSFELLEDEVDQIQQFVTQCAGQGRNKMLDCTEELRNLDIEPVHKFSEDSHSLTTYIEGSFDKLGEIKKNFETPILVEPFVPLQSSFDMFVEEGRNLDFYLLGVPNHEFCSVAEKEFETVFEWKEMYALVLQQLLSFYKLRVEKNEQKTKMSACLLELSKKIRETAQIGSNATRISAPSSTRRNKNWMQRKISNYVEKIAHLVSSFLPKKRKVHIRKPSTKGWRRWSITAQHA